MDDDDRLIRAMAAGGRDAWSVMYDRHVADVFGFLHHLVGGNRALAEELNQDVWLTVGIGFGLLAVTIAVLWPLMRREFFPEVDAGAFNPKRVFNLADGRERPGSTIRGFTDVDHD